MGELERRYGEQDWEVVRGEEEKIEGKNHGKEGP